MLGGCQKYQRDALNSVRPSSFFAQKIFFSISISRGRTGEMEVSTVPTRCSEQCATIFVFRSKNFFFDISFFGDRTGEREVSTMPIRYPEQYTTYFVFSVKKFFL